MQRIVGNAAPDSNVDTSAVVVAEHLSRSFGDLVAVKDVSLTVRRGEVFGVLGANGAGKSTTLRMLCGLLDPSSGSARVVGYDVATQPEKVKANIGYMTQQVSLYQDLSVLENLQFYAAIYGVSRRKRTQRIRDILERENLNERSQQLAGELSGGWKQRLALACATIHEPPLLFLDEPTAGVDPASRRDFWERIHQLSVEGTTVLVTTHYMDEAERCHRLAFIFSGKVLDIGTPQQIISRSQLRVAQILVDDVAMASSILSAAHEVSECAHFGSVIRMATTEGVDPVAFAKRALEGHVQVNGASEVRASIEDSFIYMLGKEQQ